MNERIFTRELQNSLRRAGWWAYKIPDSPVPKFQNGEGNIRFQPKRPFDIVACKPGGLFIAIEAKQIKAYKTFSINSLAEHQKEELASVTKAGGISLIALNIRIPRTINKCLFFGLKYFHQIQKITPFELKAMHGHQAFNGLFDFTDWNPE